MLYSRLVGSDARLACLAAGLIVCPRGNVAGRPKGAFPGPNPDPSRGRTGNFLAEVRKQMSHTWKLLPLAVFAALGALMLLATNSGPGRVEDALAGISTPCAGSGDRLRVDIMDDDAGARITIAGAEITVAPDPQDASADRDFIDNGTNDDSTAVGRIDQLDACNVAASIDGNPDVYTITLNSLPAPYDDCDYDDTVTTELTGNVTVEFTLTNCPELTPSPTPTGTASPAASTRSSCMRSTCRTTRCITCAARRAWSRT